MTQSSLIERLARHLATGTSRPWESRLEDAASILAILKEPDAAMIDAGDDGVWRAMIDAALRERWSVTPPASGEGEVVGADEEGEIALTKDAVSHDRADWTHVHRDPEHST